MKTRSLYILAAAIVAATVGLSFAQHGSRERPTEPPIQVEFKIQPIASKIEGGDDMVLIYIGTDSVSEEFLERIRESARRGFRHD